MRAMTLKERIVDSIQWTGWETRVNAPGEVATLYFFAMLKKDHCKYKKSECKNHCWEAAAYYKPLVKGAESMEAAIEDVVDGVMPMIKDKVWVESRDLNLWQKLLFKFWPFEFRRIYGDRRTYFVDWEPLIDPAFKPLPKK